jgi:hypothetical protein
MFRKCGIILGAFAAIACSLAMSPSATACHRGLFHRHYGSSGGSYGGSSTNCWCDCTSSGEASERNNESNGDHHAVSDRDDRGSRDVHGDGNGVTEERDREGHHDADRNHDRDKKHDEDMKRDEPKDKDGDQGKEKDNDKKEESKK